MITGLPNMRQKAEGRRPRLGSRGMPGWFRWVAKVPLGTLAILILALAMAAPLPARGAEQDLQQWSLILFNHHIDERWAASFQVENRVADNITQFNELILKPAGYYQFTKSLNFGFGYKYQKKHVDSNEQDIWQELYYTPARRGLFSGLHQVRLEERFIKGIGGTIPRLRYLVHVKRPLGSNEKRYLVASEAIRFNLADKGEGPVDGFEQNRLYFGVGFKMTPTLNMEIGYLWRFERERDDPDHSDHVIRLQFHFDTTGRHRAYHES